MQESQIREFMLRNYQKDKGQFPGKSNERQWVILDPDKLYRLLKDCANMYSSTANALLKQMAKKKWTITATAHEGGKDEHAPLHISVKIKNQLPHHLNCKEHHSKGLYIYEITQKPIIIN